MKKTKTIWRLGKLPDPSEVLDLVKGGILTKDEGREILISLETEEDRTKKSLQEEIKFLRELVAKLTTNRSVIVESIKYVEKPYRQYEWYQPYVQYYSAPAIQGGLTYTTTAGASSTNAVYSLNASSGTGQLSASSQAQQALGAASSFTDIKTF